MKNRRIVGVVLLLALVVLVFPTAGQALEPGQLGGEVEPGLFARFLEWVEAVVFAPVVEVWVALEGATITPAG